MLDVLFSYEYGKLNERIENGECEVINFQCEYGKVRYLFIKRKINIPIKNIEYFDIVSPYGYGGPLVLEWRNKKKLLLQYYDFFSRYCLEHNIVSEFIRFHLFDNSEARKLFYGETIQQSTNIVRDFKLSLDEIWMEFDPKVRKNVKRALSKDLKINIDTEGTNLSAFLEIYYKTMERNNADNYYYFPKEYFVELNEKLKGYYAYFNVLLENKIISTELVLFSDNYVYSFLGGTIVDYYEYRPNDFLKYEIIKWCKETEKTYFILGGGYHEDDGIYRYKKSFAPTGYANFYIGKKIHNQKIYADLVEIRSQEQNFNVNTKYFPAYRG